ncbi:alpha/beta hydrolase family protein [Clostridium lundense]|uniref:alpha/beta hydrolase family protein n=1 Tax=Clostridium lundense TaxID=319475 RepID=UPI00048371B0|nr:alpha/beta fold hydrolase [Clostridium lundense]
MNKKAYSIFTVILMLSIFFIGCSNSKPPKIDKFSGYYDKDIQTFKSSFVKKAPSMDEYEKQAPPSYVSQVAYESNGLKLRAWVLNDPKKGDKYPAVVFMHGGFAFDKWDWEVAEEYINRGYVVMTPMVRGENGNPGNFEYFYGEVRDCIAAGKYLANLPYVDKDNIFLMGHSAGGSLGVLASMLDSPYKAIATNGASYGTEIYFEQKKDRIPFEYNKDEIHIRSSYEYANSIKTPVYAFVGKEDTGILYLSKEFEKKAKKFNVPYKLTVIAGDHNGSLDEAIQLSADIFDSYVKKK